MFRRIPSTVAEVTGDYESLAGAVHTEEEAQALDRDSHEVSLTWEVVPYIGSAPGYGASRVWVAVDTALGEAVAAMSPSPLAVFDDPTGAMTWRQNTVEPVMIWEVTLGRIDLSCPQWPRLDG